MWNVVNQPYVKQRLAFDFRRIKRQGIFYIFRKTITKSLSFALWFFLLPATLLLHFAGYRRTTVFTDRIGHLALEPDCLLKEQALGHIPKRKWILLAPPGRVANEHLLSYWETHFIIVRHPMLCFLISSMSKWLLMRYDISHYVQPTGKPQAAYQLYAEWGSKPPLLKLNEEDEHWADEKLKELGLPVDAWFVCVHVREPGFSPVDEELQSHRNASIQNTIPAMQQITRCGGWVIRIGDPTMTPLTKIPRVIDYACHPLKCDRMDIILCAKARFILGNTSGLAIVGSIFGVPCALANIIPVIAVGFGIHDINIPKLLWSTQLSRYLTYPEILASPISSFVYARLYQENNIIPKENSSEDIRWLVLEMLEALDIIDRKNSDIKPGKSIATPAAGIGNYFIEKNQELF
jgi:putative glycosyltransferase (TIGR04372 family)